MSHSAAEDREPVQLPTPRKRPGQTLRRKAVRFALILLIPAVLCELLIHIIPMIIGIWMAFLELDQRTLVNWTQAPFAGLSNFMLGLDPNSIIGSAFVAAVGRTALYVVITLGFCWVLGMAAAVFLNTSFRGTGLLRTLFLTPYIIPTYIGSIAWSFMLNQKDGVVNELLVNQLGILAEKPYWLLGDAAFASLVLVTVWTMWPFAFLMLLAALQSIPISVYEAAAIDGASRWKQFWKITVPMIKYPNLALLLILGLWMFNQFDVPYVLFGPTSPEQARLVSPLIYENAFSSWRFGLGGAMSVVLLLLMVVVSIFYMRLVMPKGGSDD